MFLLGSFETKFKSNALVSDAKRVWKVAVAPEGSTMAVEKGQRGKRRESGTGIWLEKSEAPGLPSRNHGR
jgi:hypothetical protein